MKKFGSRIIDNKKMESPKVDISEKYRVEFISATHFDDVGICFDLGHAHLMGDVAQAFEILKPHIRSTHLHDNAKDRDAHLWPGKGSIDWKQAMELLRSAPHAPPLLLEVEGDDKSNLGERMAEAFERLGD